MGKAEDVHMLYYEKLCLDTANEIYKLLQFMGGCYAGISLESVRETLAAHKELQCKHSEDLDQVNGADQLQWLSSWSAGDLAAFGKIGDRGYSHGVEWILTLSALKKMAS